MLRMIEASLDTMKPFAGRLSPRGASCLLAAVTALAALAGAAPRPAAGQTLLKSICRVKGQEEYTLQGLGIVVGLKGTGDGSSFLPMVRSLSKIMTVMGQPPGQAGLAELKDAKNVALVTVSVSVPPDRRRGDRIDCTVSSIGAAKSLAGGRLFLTALIGPEKQDNPVIYAFAEGPISLDDPELPTSGKIFRGCRLLEDFPADFTSQGKITLVLDRSHADFQVAQEVAELINGQLSFQSSGLPLARAVDQVNVEVTIPSQYREDPVLFVSQVLGLQMLEPQTGPRVVINERAGSIVISGDAEIGAVAVTHKNVVIETGVPAANRFVPVDPAQKETARLKSLVEALNAVHVPTEDVIDIIKGLDRNGKLYAQLIIE
jgi:flagellar P-ring protein precursor FlgI